MTILVFLKDFDSQLHRNVCSWKHEITEFKVNKRQNYIKKKSVKLYFDDFFFRKTYSVVAKLFNQAPIRFSSFKTRPAGVVGTGIPLNIIVDTWGTPTLLSEQLS